MKFNWRTHGAAAILSALLVGCGGAANEQVHNFGAVNVALAGGTVPVNAGNAITVQGTATTPTTRLSAITWSANSPAGAPAAQVGNGDCANANKVTTVSHAASGTTPATGSSVWSCGVSVSVPANLAQDTSYTVTFSATDEFGTTQSQTQAITFLASTSQGQALVANAGGAFMMAPGATAAMHCAATGGLAPYSFTWSIPVNGGTSVSLSTYSGADTQLVAPAQPAAIGVECQVSDSRGSSAQTLVNVTVASGAGGSSLTASAGSNFSVQSGTTAPMQCSTQGASGAVTYAWSIKDSGGLPVALTATDSQQTSFVAPTVTAPTSIVAQCVATDSSTATASSLVTVTVNPSKTVEALTANAGPNFAVTAGQTAPFHCDAFGGTGPYAFQWVTTDTGNLPIALSTYNAADTKYTAPAVVSDTPVTLSCRATDNVGTVSTSTVTSTIQAQNLQTAQSTLVAHLSNATVVTPGQVVQLQSTGTGWYDATGKATTGPVVTYSWSSSDLEVVFSDSSSAPTFVVPTSITMVTQIPVTMTVTSGGQTSTATTIYTVDPFGAMTLTITPPAAAGSVATPTAYTFAASATYTGAARNLYYQWTQVSGPATPLGGESTSTLGVAPTAAGQYVFRIAVGYQPIDAINPGLYFADVVLTLQ
jgi:hypothetical protein